MVVKTCIMHEEIIRPLDGTEAGTKRRDSQVKRSKRAAPMHGGAAHT
jgi:hypothetical protein